jgi:dihydrofolate synthase / folylpolyglutamate synthase
MPTEAANKKRPVSKTVKPTTTKASTGEIGAAKSGDSVAGKRVTGKPSTGKSSGGKGSGNNAINNYQGALRWLYAHTDHERLRIVHYDDKSFSLARMHAALELLGNPHREIKTVQIAGTKGKGSTCAMLASMMQYSGYTVGLYTSPHLVDIRERIQINGEMINQNDLTELFRQVAAAEEKMGEGLTFFEILTVAALKYYADQAVDIAVLETGLGGRLDSVTAVTPLVCGLTGISYDHMNILGKELPQIALEKAGIMKEGVPVISVEQDPAVAKVFDDHALATGTTVEYTGKQIDFSYRFEANRELGPHTRVCITTPTSRWEHLPVPLRGEHQAHNCGLALSILDKLKAHGFTFPEEKVVAGLSSTKIPGRMEQIWTSPRVMVDGAHNAASIQALIRALGAHVAYDSLVVIFGCCQDKDTLGMLKQLALGADKVIFTKAKNNARATEPEDLLSKFNDLSGKMAQNAVSFDEALKVAGRAVSREDLIIVTGSFYLVGEAKRYFTELAVQKKLRA